MSIRFKIKSEIVISMFSGPKFIKKNDHNINITCHILKVYQTTSFHGFHTLFVAHCGPTAFGKAHLSGYLEVRKSLPQPKPNRTDGEAASICATISPMWET